MKLFPGFNHERKEKSSVKKEFFCCEHSYIYSSMYPSKDEYSVRLDIIVQILCANIVDKNQEAMA